MAGGAPSVVIAGGGFCGAMCALHLLRDHPDLPFSLEVIEPRPLLGAGLAYSTGDGQHRINVAASRMSPFPEDELHFDRWLRDQAVPERDPRAVLPDGRIYAQRGEVGRYADGLVRAAALTRRNVVFRHTRQRAVAARVADGGFVITVQDGGTRHADALVLAVGHPPPVLPPVLRPLTGHRLLVADPWDGAAVDAIPRATPVLILGTGLTACDVIASLRGRGHTGRLTALSRHGLLPRPRTAAPVEPDGDFASDPARGAGALLRRVRATIVASRAAGRPWENVIDALRRQGREVWGALPAAERRRFLRHVRAFWDAHRFQSAPQIADLIGAELAGGGLEVLAGSLRSIEPVGEALVARVQPRGTAEAARAIERVAGAVVACVGPGHASVVETNELLSSLARGRLLHADPWRLGIEVDEAARCLDADGFASDNLFVAGPLARGTDGELMGLPQVSTQPRAVAARLAGLLASLRPAHAWSEAAPAFGD